MTRPEQGVATEGPDASPGAGPRRLLVAYQCGPGMGSVSQIGWEWFQRLAPHAPVTLVTHARNREAIERAGLPPGNAEIVYIDTEWFAGRLWRLAKRLFPRSEHGAFLISSLDYFVFDATAVRRLRRRAGDFDVVHRVTPVTPWAPTRLTALGLPVILGPLNGGLGAASHAPTLARADGEQLRHLRLGPRLLDILWGSTRRATTILAATAATLASVPPRYRHKVRRLVENGVDARRFGPAPWPPAPSAATPLRVAFVGRLVPIKGVELLLDAIADRPADRPVELHVVGDGPLLGDLRARSAARALAKRVCFHGALPPEAVADVMRHAHLLCLPSVRESGGAVLLEAMACARPVVAVDFGGPAEIVDADVGALLPAGAPSDLVAAIARILDDVYDHPDVWQRRGANARARVLTRFTWEAKIASALALHRELVRPRSREPGRVSGVA